MDVADVVNHKVGPLPAWGWALAVGGAGFVYLKFIHKSPAAATAASMAPLSGTTYSTAPNGTQGANLGGFDSSGADAQLMGLQAAGGELQTQVQQVGQQLGQQLSGLQASVSALPSQLPVVAQPQPAPAPVSTPASSAANVLGSIIGKADAAWQAGLGEYYLVTPDLYGQAAPGQPGYGTHGAGANEVAAYLNRLYPNARITPTQLAQWNGGQQWYTPGQQLYVGSFKGGVGH